MITVYRPTRHVMKDSYDTIKLIGNEACLNHQNPLTRYYACRDMNIFPKGDSEISRTQVRAFVEAVQAGMLHPIQVDCELDRVFEVCNTIHEAWIKNPEVLLTRHDLFTHSMSVGDLFVFEDAWYIVCADGFKRMNSK